MKITLIFLFSFYYYVLFSISLLKDMWCVFFFYYPSSFFLLCTHMHVGFSVYQTKYYYAYLPFQIVKIVLKALDHLVGCNKKNKCLYLDNIIIRYICVAEAKRKKRPNIIIIMISTHRFLCLGAYVGKNEETKFKHKE